LCRRVGGSHERPDAKILEFGNQLQVRPFWQQLDP
jgi:hypothetical protein